MNAETVVFAMKNMQCWIKLISMHILNDWEKTWFCNSIQACFYCLNALRRMCGKLVCIFLKI